VLEGVEAELLSLAATDDAARWGEMTSALAARVAAARAEVARAHDPLLDLRSCDLRAVRALAEQGGERIGARLRPGSDAETALRAVASLLETRLEAVTIEAAKRVGLAVDVEVDVLPGQVSFNVGPELKVDALAGFDLSEDRTVLGSFRRDVAVQHEEHDSFATGHPLVEALFSWVRDGELGRATVARAHLRGQAGAALDARFLVILPEPADLAQGARVPSRRAARHLDEALVRVAVRLDGRGSARVDDGLAAQLASAEVDTVPAPDGGPPATFVQAVESGLRVARDEAERRLRRLIEEAKRGVAAEKESASRRLSRWLSQSQVPAASAEKVLAAEAKLYDDAAAALEGARLELDQAALVQLA
jgi:ATP-dependent helicase HepA